MHLHNNNRMLTWEKVNICLNYVLKSLKQGGYLAEDFNINNIRK